MDQLCCTQRPSKGIRTGQDPFAAASATAARQCSDNEPDEDLSFAGRALSMFGGGSKKDKQPKAASPDDGFIGKTMSFVTGGAVKKREVSNGLPLNWTKSKDKDGKECYVNSITHLTQYSIPRPLPKGWVEMLHKESGRPMYKNVATREVVFTFPEEDAENLPPSGRDSNRAVEDESFLGKTMSFMTGGGKRAQAAHSKPKRAEEPAAEKSSRPERVFISATSLIKEAKLCVGPQQHPGLDKLAAELASRKITAEQAIPKLQALVGTTLVQQAAICVQNLKAGTLPHGWIEYLDPATKRSYYYNAHSKETTWHRPKPAEKSSSAEHILAMPESEDAVGVDYQLSTHEIKLSAEL